MLTIQGLEFQHLLPYSHIKIPRFLEKYTSEHKIHTPRQRSFQKFLWKPIHNPKPQNIPEMSLGFIEETSPKSLK